MLTYGIPDLDTLGMKRMKDYLPTLVIVCIALAWFEFRYQQLSSRIDRQETQSEIYTAKPSNKKSSNTIFNKKEPSFSKKYESKNKKTRAQKIKELQKKNDTKSSTSLDLTNPDVQEELHQFLEEREKEQKEIQRAEGVGKYLDYVEKRIETYTQNHQLPSSVSQAAMIEIQMRTNEYVAVEHAAEDGDMDWSEAKPEMERIKEEGKANLIEILGEEEYQEFERFVWSKE